MVRHGFGYFFEAHKLERPPARPLRGDAARRRCGRAGVASSARGQHLREVLDELGPTFVKFGQLLSTRPDVVPPDIVVELRGLQDDVRPFPFEQAERVIEEELGNTLERLFLDFEPGAGRGRVDRPGAPRDAAERAPRRGQGAAAGRTAADRGRPRRSSTRRRGSRASGSARSTSSTRASSSTSSRARSGKELDYRHEGRNAQNFHRHFAGDPHVRVPKVYWQYTRAARADARVDRRDPARRRRHASPMTLEERREIAYRITETWMAMIFRHGFFHGDPHPANILMLDRGGDDRPRRLRRRRDSSPTTTCRS